MAALLQARDLRKAFGGLVAVNGVSLSVSPGEVLGLIGPNGSGKTTLLNLIAGTIRSDAGAILMDGEDVTRLPNHLRVRKRINRTFQLVRMPANLSAIETVMAGVLYGAGERVRFKDAGYVAAGCSASSICCSRRIGGSTSSPISSRSASNWRVRSQPGRASSCSTNGSRAWPGRARGWHVGGLEPRRAGNGGDSGRACDDRGARALRSRNGDERRRQDRRRSAAEVLRNAEVIRAYLGDDDA